MMDTLLPEGQSGEVQTDIPESSPSGSLFRRHGEDGRDVDDRFDVKFPKRAIAPLLILYIILLGGQYYYIGDVISVFILFLLTLIPIVLWAGLGPAFAEKIILNWLYKVRDKKIPRANELFVGFPARTKDIYYIEANSMDLKMDNFLQVINRVKEVVFLSIGISILTAKILGVFFFDNLSQYWDVVMGDPYIGLNELVFDTAIFLGPFALLVLFLVIPLFWIAEDMQIYRIDTFQDTRRIGRYLRSGLLSKLLGLIGIILAYDTARGYAIDLHGVGADALALYMTTFTQFGLIIVACAGAPLLVAVVYLLRYHDIWVNNVRIKASEFIPVGTLEISYVKDEEKEWLGHPERIAVSQDRLVRFLKTPPGKNVLFILLLLGIAGTMFMGFIFTGVWTDPIYFP